MPIHRTLALDGYVRTNTYFKTTSNANFCVYYKNKATVKFSILGVALRGNDLPPNL